MTADEWRDALLRAAECGSDCLRDTWTTVPAEMKDDLGLAMHDAVIVATAADWRKASE